MQDGHSFYYHLYNHAYDEIRSIDPKTSFSREEYEEI